MKYNLLYASESAPVPQSESNAGKYCVISRENEGSTEVTLPVNNWERAEVRHSQSLRQNRRDEETKHSKDEVGKCAQLKIGTEFERKKKLLKA